MPKLIKIKHLIIIFISIFAITLTLYFLLINLHTKKIYTFNNLESFEKYANFYPENYEIENNDWQDPSFVNFYKTKLNQSYIKNFFVKLKLKKDPLFNIINFENLLEKITATKKINNKNKNINIGETLELKKDDSCIVFGDLHASLHSLVRDLFELKNQNIINQDLKITRKNTYIIFLGDTINRGLYSLETLNIILLLIEKNPEKVIYLKGNHETRKYWRNFNMRRQIQTIFPKHANLKQEDNLPDKIDAFFDTLPKTLIINIAGQKDDSILLASEDKKSYFDNKKNIKFMLVGEKKLNANKKKTGLEFIDYDYGITKWSLMSCPNIIYQKFFDLYQDSFVELTIGPLTRKSILTLNYHDLREKDKKFKQIFYAPISGKILETKDNMGDRKTYNIGSTMYLSGITAVIGQENKTGLEAALYKNNFDPKNYLIKPFIFDDEYLQSLASLNIKKFLNQYNIETIVYPTGTPTLMSYMDLIESGKVSVFFPYTGGKQIRKKELKNLINFRANYNSEIISMIRYLVKEFNIRKFAFFYTDDSYGQPIAEDARNELKKLGINEWLDLPHSRSNPNLDNRLIGKIREYMPEAIASLSIEAITEELIDKLSPEFFSNTILFSLSAMNGQSFERFLKSHGIKQVLSSVVPDPFTSDLQIVKEFRTDMDQLGLSKSFNALEGYIVGSLMALAINSVPYPASREKIMAFFEAMNNYKFKGLELTFNPETRDLSQPVWIRNLESKWIKY